MITVADAILIKAPPATVFKFLLDPKKLQQTLPSILSITIDPNEFPGPGRRMQWVLQKKDGTTVSWNEEYTAYQENHLLRWKTTSGPTWTGEFRLYTVSDGTFLVMMESTDYFDTLEQHERVVQNQLKLCKQLIETK